MAAWLGPASLRRGPRSVYICVPDTLRPYHQAQIATVLADVVRLDDRLLTAGALASAGSDPVVAYAEQHGHAVSPIVGEHSAPDLIVIVLDPLGDNTAALQARALASGGDSDLLIAELPELAG
jgi:hypothetical protein